MIFFLIFSRKSLDHKIDDDFLFRFFPCGEEEINYRLCLATLMCLMNRTFDLKT